ncbi:hypothetical protein LMED105_00135 [Limnobacter sp. MED105]|nr:hypothetical protein LMED105_00135 [Limnobacter sp. MED105]
MFRLLVFAGGLGAQVFIFGLVLLYIVPFFFGVATMVSFREALVGAFSKANSSVVWQDVKNGFSFSIATIITFLIVFHRKVIWQWLSQFI